MPPQCLKAFSRIYSGDKSVIQKDGILNPALYTKAPLKVLWFLKETWVHESWKKVAKEKSHLTMGGSPTYQPIAYVMHGIFNGFIRYEEMDFIRDDPKIFDCIRSTALINAKKTLGQNRSHNGTVFHHYKRSKEALLKQVERIDPDVLIGCPPHFGDFMETFAPSSEVTSEGSVDWAVSPGGKLCVYAYHPQQTQVTRDVYVDDILRVVERFAGGGRKAS